MSKLTDHLLSTFSHYIRAAEHPFLKSAGSLTHLDDHVALYLFQEHAYCTHGFPRFIAQLILKIPLDRPEVTPLASRTLSLLAGCLAYGSTALDFTDGTARDSNFLSEEWRERKGLKDLISELTKFGTFASLEDSLLFLWGVERIFSDLWSSVYHALPASSQASGDAGAKAIRTVAYKWSNANPEFKAFLGGIGDLVDDYFAPAMAGEPSGGQSAQEVLARAGEIFERAIDLVSELWPNEGDETKYRRAL